MLVDTPGYSIPKYDPWDKDLVEGLVNEGDMPNCNSTKIPTLTTQRIARISDEEIIGVVVFHKENAEFYSKEGQVQCCHKEVSYTENHYQIDPNSYSIESDCKVFKERETIFTIPLIYVRCWDETGDVYSNLHYFPNYEYIKSLVNSKPKEIDENLNVVIIGLESVSRYDFLRYLPKSYAILSENNAIDLRAFNKINDGTRMNLWDLLVNPTLKRSKTCPIDDINTMLDDCKFLWEKFKGKGYITLYGDDSQTKPRFDLFSRQPTDIYFNAIFNVQKDVHRESDSSHEERLEFDCRDINQLDFNILSMLVDHVKELHSRPYFSVIFSENLSKSEFRLIKLLDDILYNFINDMNRDDSFKDTLLILLSEGGRIYRPRSYSSHFFSKMEHRLPFAFMKFPHWFKTKFPLAYKNIYSNQDRLTTINDISYTLIDILNKKYSDEFYLKKENKIPNYSSLFKAIPDVRNCQLADISLSNCASLKGRNIGITSQIEPVLRFIRSEINTKLATFNICDDITGIIPISIYTSQTNIPRLKRKRRHSVKKSGLVTVYTILVAITPGEARVEFTIIDYESEHYEIGGDLRIVKGKITEGQCILHPILKYICDCPSIAFVYES